MKSYFKAYKDSPLAVKIISPFLVVIGLVIILLFSAALATQFTNIGTVFGILAALYSVIMGLLMPTQLIGKANAKRIIYHIFLDIYIVLVVFAAVLSGLMIGALNNTPAKGSDATVVVLGCQVRADGTPSLMLRNRINAAAEYLKANPQADCIVSGGKGGNEPISEAEAMYNELIKLGISDSRIKKEDKSDNTVQNLEFSKPLLDGKTDIIIVTDGFHQYRASLMAKSFGMQSTAINADTPSFLLPLYWVREWLAICHFAVFGE